MLKAPKMAEKRMNQTDTQGFRKEPLDIKSYYRDSNGFNCTQEILKERNLDEFFKAKYSMVDKYLGEKRSVSSLKTHRPN